MAETTILERLKQGTAPRNLRMAIAEGMIPLEGAELVESLGILTLDPDDEVKNKLAENLPTLPRPFLLQITRESFTPPQLLSFIADLFPDDDDILMHIILNKSVLDNTLTSIASYAPPTVLTLLSENKHRMLTCPELLETLLANDELPRVNRYALQEFKESWAEALIASEKRKAKLKREVSGGKPEKTFEADKTFDSDEMDMLETDRMDSGIAEKPEQVAVQDSDIEADLDLSKEIDRELDGIGIGEVREEPRTAKVEKSAEELLEGWDFTDLSTDDDVDLAEDEFGFEIGEFKQDETEVKAGDQGESLEGWEDLDLDEPDSDIDTEQEFIKELEEEEKIQDTRSRLLQMSGAEKIQVAKMGTKQERAILVRDGNKKVAIAVIQSPKITEFEIKMIAANRSINEDVLREIYLHREWGQAPGIQKELVLNPKTPLSISLRLLSKLNDFDLKDACKSKEIPYGLTAAAKRLQEQREMRRQRHAKH
ncbi:hypothetical protein JXA40_00155 [bacterium]|nr:hypothetical protein [candidate division CSSED10-310 bacterium]